MTPAAALRPMPTPANVAGAWPCAPQPAGFSLGTRADGLTDRFPHYPGLTGFAQRTFSLEDCGCHATSASEAPSQGEDGGRGVQSGHKAEARQLPASPSFAWCAPLRMNSGRHATSASEAPSQGEGGGSGVQSGHTAEAHRQSVSPSFAWCVLRAIAQGEISRVG